MRVGRGLLAGGLALLLGSGCLDEVGAKCLESSNCPSGQFCSGGFCAAGDGGASDGGDGGPLAPIAGTVTLNGGFAEPASNTAWVLAWDHAPAIYDSGVEDPQLIAQTGPDGSFAFGDAGIGTTYHLAVAYDIDADGVFDQPGDRFDLLGSTVQAGAAGSNELAVDAQTSGCIAWSIFNGDTGTTTILALIADIPDVLTGNELPSSSVKSAAATDPNENNYGLSQVTGTGIAELDGKYAWTPSGLGTPPTAPPGNYHFDLTAQGYPHGTCDVQHQPLTQAPVITSVPKPWHSAAANQVAWTSAPGTEFDEISLDTINSDGSEGPQQYSATNVVSPATIPAGACPIGRCRVIVTSTHTVSEELRAGSFASAASSDVVTGT